MHFEREALAADGVLRGRVPMGLGQLGCEGADLQRAARAEVQRHLDAAMLDRLHRARVIEAQPRALRGFGPVDVDRRLRAALLAEREVGAKAAPAGRAALRRVIPLDEFHF